MGRSDGRWSTNSFGDDAAVTRADFSTSAAEERYYIPKVDAADEDRRLYAIVDGAALYDSDAGMLKEWRSTQRFLQMTITSRRGHERQRGTGLMLEGNTPQLRTHTTRTRLVEA